MTLQLLHSEFPYTVYEENLIFVFISERLPCFTLMLLGQVVSGASRYSTLKMTTPHSTAVQPMCLSRLAQIRGLPRDVVYLGWPIATSYMSPNAGGGGGCGVSANEDSFTQGAQINFGDLTPYLTYGRVVRESERQCLSRYFPGFDPSILRHSGI